MYTTADSTAQTTNSKEQRQNILQLPKLQKGDCKSFFVSVLFHFKNIGDIILHIFLYFCFSQQYLPSHDSFFFCFSGTCLFIHLCRQVDYQQFYLRPLLQLRVVCAKFSKASFLIRFFLVNVCLCSYTRGISLIWLVLCSWYSQHLYVEP